ncbi:MAG TPA: hypothetical protein VIH92_06530 [Solirubrobacteraceae bacterium]
MFTSKRRPQPALAAVLLVVLASLLLAACGGSSTSSTSSTGTSASAAPSTTPTGKAPAGGANRFAALRECLKKNGITLPKFTPGKRPSATTHGAFLPKGVSKSQYEAAVKKCGGRGTFAGGAGRFSSPQVKQALAKFSSCMRENGVAIPKANTSGKGPIFSSKNLNTSSAKFKTAETKCAKDLGGAFHARPGAAGGGAPGGPGGAPPAAG